MWIDDGDGLRCDQIGMSLSRRNGQQGDGTIERRGDASDDDNVLGLIIGKPTRKSDEFYRGDWDWDWIPANGIITIGDGRRCRPRHSSGETEMPTGAAIILDQVEGRKRFKITSSPLDGITCSGPVEGN